MKLAIALALVSAQPAAAPDPLAWMAGNWRGAGTSLGNPGTASLKVAPALHGKFYELSYALATTGKRAFRFEGRAFYRLSGDKWQAHWFDSRGTTFAIDAKMNGTSLTSDWAGTAEKGRTVYRLREDGRLEVVDTVAAPDGSRREFARFVYDRVDAPKH